MKTTKILAVLGFLTLATGCTGKTSFEAIRGYEIPDAVCGVEIDKSKYEPLFPTGEEVEEEVVLPPERGEGSCIIRVDGDDVFDINANRMSRDSGVEGAIRENGYRLSVRDSIELKGSPYEIRIWQNQAIAYIECTRSDFGSTGIGITFYISTGSESDYTDTLSRIMDPYIKGRLAQIDPAYCTPA